MMTFVETLYYWSRILLYCIILNDMSVKYDNLKIKDALYYNDSSKL